VDVRDHGGARRRELVEDHHAIAVADGDHHIGALHVEGFEPPVPGGPGAERLVAADLRPAGEPHPVEVDRIVCHACVNGVFADAEQVTEGDLGAGEKDPAVGRAFRLQMGGCRSRAYNRYAQR
jgi:hypothetical protein